MYVCICIRINVNVCHVYIVCHEYIYTSVHLVRVNLDIMLLVVSDGDDSVKGWKSLFEYVGVFEVHELYDFFVHSEHRGRRVLGRKILFWRGKIVISNRRELHMYPPRGITMGRGREWELPERNDSCNLSRKYSRELWEVTSLLSQATTWGLPASTMDSRRRHLRSARGSANSGFFRVQRYLLHPPSRTHTRPRTLRTPLHATTLHSHILPVHTCAHLYPGMHPHAWTFHDHAESTRSNRNCGGDAWHGTHTVLTHIKNKPHFDIIPKYSSQRGASIIEVIQCRHCIQEVKFLPPSRNRQTWSFTNNTLGLPPAHSWSVCMFL